jgi:AbrB family looped-hinge helix DNA binding protein
VGIYPPRSGKCQNLATTAIVEENGRIVIPANVRKQLGIKPGTELEIDVEKGSILMRPVRKVSAKNLLGVGGKERVNLEEIESSLASE